MTTCIVNGCTRDAAAKGYCHLHYNRWRRHGDRWLEQQADEDEDAQGWSYEPDPDEAHDRMQDDRMEREAEETWH